MTDKSIMDTARHLGGILGYDPIPEIPLVETKPMRMTRADIWPPETLAEMKQIWSEMP